MAYFFQKLPTLRSEQKVAACNLGIFPGSGATMASVSTASATTVAAPLEDQDRIGAIEQWLSQRPASPSPAPAATAPQMASVSLPPSVTGPAARSDASGAVYTSSKLWLQLATGINSVALPEQFSRMRSRGRELFDGINGYVVEEDGKARLLVGPFRNSEEANIFAEDLASVHIDAFTWTSRPGQIVRKLPTE
jgi:cell division septation protein DedD